MSRGSLRIYLGASPGVGKTFKMLSEGVRRQQRGTDVVIGLVETHGRVQTAEQLGHLPLMPLKQSEHRGASLREMDVAAILARHPEVVLVDEYAHTNAPGSLNEKRWQDVELLLEAGIDVISTLNIQHLESLNDVITRITGTVQRETVPDAVVRRADQLELVDMSPEAIRRRMAHGNIYPADRVDAALANYFRPGNLSALRELALLWLADRVEESLQTYLTAHGVAATWETRERVVVGITGSAGGEAIIRRAARMAGRVSGDLIGVHVVVDDGLSQHDSEALRAQRQLVAELGGTVHEVVGHDTAEALAEFARREKATQLVLGASLRSRRHELVHGSFVARVTRMAGEIDVHVIARRDADDDSERDRGRGRRRTSTVRARRTVVGMLLTFVALPLLVAATLPFRDDLDLSTEILLVLLLVLGIAAVGGRLVGALAAVAASLLLNLFFVEPYRTLTIAEPEHVITLAAFVVVAVAVGSLVDTVTQRSLEARRARLEAEAIARSTTSLAADADPVPHLVEHLRSTFDLEGINLTTVIDGAATVVATSGEVHSAPSATLSVSAGPTDRPRQEITLRTFGRQLSADDHRLLRILADQLAVALESKRLAAEADEAASLADIDAVRTALLHAVSHDLRSPLASIKAMISGVRDTSVNWSAEQLAEAHATIEEEADRLNQLVGNLLDASRLQIGALAVDIQPATVADVIGAALHSLDAPRSAVRTDVPEVLPAVLCDRILLERSLANVIGNALRFTPAGRAVDVQAAFVRERVHLRIIDTGVGIRASERTKVTAPFQRLGDQPAGDGVGLGLSIAKGFVEAMGGALELDDTPGGGLTVTISLPPATESPLTTHRPVTTHRPEVG